MEKTKIACTPEQMTKIEENFRQQRDERQRIFEMDMAELGESSWSQS